MPSPPPQPSSPPPDGSAITSTHRPESASGSSEPLAKRAKPNPQGDSGFVEPAPISTRSPTSALPFDPAHPTAMASNHDEAPKTAGAATDRPSLPSMASLMSPDPNSSGSLPVPPNTAAFPPPSAVGSGPPGMSALGLGLAMQHQLQPHAVPPLQIKLLVSEAKAPTRGSAFAAGYDLYAAEETSIEKGGRKLVSTGIACAVPSGTYARIAPRSGLAVKHGIATGAGVVDEDYRGEVKVLLFNHGDSEFKIQPGDRIAQMVLERIVTPEVKVMDELEESVRGAGGFGSTGGFGGQT